MRPTETQTVAAPRLGLILSERLLNCPPEVRRTCACCAAATHTGPSPAPALRARQLAPPLTSGLFEEISDVGGDWWWQTEAAPSDALRDAYRFDAFLLLTRVYRDDAPDEGGGGAGPSGAAPRGAKRAKGDGAAAGGGPSPAPPRLVYPKPEDEAFHRAAAWAFTFPAAVPEATAVSDRAAGLTQLRLAMCVDARRAADVQRDTERLVAAALAGGADKAAPQRRGG